MSDNENVSTPTTKMVKHFFANGHRDRWFISYNERLAQFDRWITGLLTRTYSQGAADERERIIDLLEAEMCAAYGEDCTDNPACYARNRMIALIRGENE